MSIDWVALITWLNANPWLDWLLKSLVLVFALLTGFAYMTFAERKVLAGMQVRIGPNRAGPGGWLQPAADGLKLLFKEELIPAQADKVVFVLAPIVTVIPALIVLAVLPFGPSIKLCAPQAPQVCYTLQLGLADLNVAVLYVLAVASISVYGIVLAGWASNNKYAMMGGLRSSAQMVSYELALGLAAVTPILLSGSMSLVDIVEAQRQVWFVWLQPVGALIFFVASLAEVNRTPFDIPEAEQELTAGYHTEYSGMKFSLFFMAEYIKMIAVSALAATLFFGGYRGPFVDELPVLGIAYISVKTAGFLFLMIWLRATLPRMRYDRLMAFGWKGLLPLALANVMVTAAAAVSPTALWVTIGGLGVVALLVFITVAGRARPATRG